MIRHIEPQPLLAIHDQGESPGFRLRAPAHTSRKTKDSFLRAFLPDLALPADFRSPFLLPDEHPLDEVSRQIVPHGTFPGPDIDLPDSGLGPPEVLGQQFRPSGILPTPGSPCPFGKFPEGRVFSAGRSMKRSRLLVPRGRELLSHHPVDRSHHDLFNLRFVAPRLLVVDL